MIALAITFPGKHAAALEYRGSAHVVDGDTIEIADIRIRFFGIDAPEGKQLCKDAEGEVYACGRRSTQHLRRLIGKQTVICTDLGQAQFGRRWGHCTVGGTDLQKAMVLAGHAIAFLPHNNAYVGDERIARSEKRGLWQGVHSKPGDVRRCRRQGRGTIPSCSF